MAEESMMFSIGANVKNFIKGFGMAEKQFKKLYTKEGTLNQKSLKLMKTWKRLGVQTRHLTAGIHGFKMEMLSVMFGGQMLAGAMWGLLQPAMEATGIFEIFGAMLQTLFLPIALALLDVLLPIMVWFMGAPE